MKTTIILLCASCAALPQYAQNNSAAGNTAAGSANSSTAGSTQTLPPGLNKQQPLPSGLQNRDNLPPGLSQRAVNPDLSTNLSTAGPGVDIGVNSPDQRQLGTLSNSVTPTSNAGTTNRVSGNNISRGIQGANVSTNLSGNVAGSTRSTLATQDKAFTAADQKLLFEVRKQALPVIGASEWASPVHFQLQNGVVTLVGLVPSVEQQQRLVGLVQQTPGVTRVIDQLTVDANANVQAGAAGISNNALTPTSSNSINRIYPNQQGLPPGLEKKEQLPPGQSDRQQLPPGLQKREQLSPSSNTNNTPNAPETIRQ